MTHRNTLLLLGIAACLLSACNREKSTQINGTVVDSVTGAPIGSARVTVSIEHKPTRDHGVSYQYIDLVTDARGQFSFENELKVSIGEVLKPGYVYHTGTGAKLTQDDVNDLNIALVPEDGFFRLNVVNEQASSDSVFIRVFSQIQLDEAGISSGKILKKTVPLFSAGTNEFFISSASEAYLKIYWSFSPVMYDKLEDYPFVDSVYIARQDTASYTLTF